MLLFLLLVFLPVVPIETEVVRTLADCPGFFLDETPPVIPRILVGGKIRKPNRYKILCKTFLTLYDTKKKIPFFSAYRFTGGAKGRPKQKWKTERQLKVSKQAQDRDYKNKQGYDRGHLYPNNHAPDNNAKRSTFTLTNAVPQSKRFNRGKWRTMEGCIKCDMEKDCKDENGRFEAFVVVGAKPGKTKLNNKINIPSRMWSAFCCYNSREGVWLSKAFWGDNELEKCGLTEGSYTDIKNKFEIEIFPGSQCSSKEDLNPPRKRKISKRTIFCSKSPCECLLENSTTTAPPTTKDQTSETPTTVITTAKMTTTLPTTTKTTQTTTSTTTKSTTKKRNDNDEENKGRNPGNNGGGGGGGPAITGIFGSILGLLGGFSSGIVASITGAIAIAIGSGGPVVTRVSGGGNGGIRYPIINTKFTYPTSKTLVTKSSRTTSIIVPTANEKTKSTTSVTQTTEDDRTRNADGEGGGDSSTALLTPTTPKFTASPRETHVSTTFRTTVLTTPETSKTVPTTNENTRTTPSVTQTSVEISTGNADGEGGGESSTSLLTATTKKLTSSPSEIPVSTTFTTTVLTTPQTSCTPTITKQETSTANISTTTLPGSGTNIQTLISFIFTSSQTFETFSLSTFAPATYMSSQAPSTFSQLNLTHPIELKTIERPTEDDDFYYYYYYNYYYNALNNQANHYLSCN
uniref:DNA/RNA non-specific endonuclease domain-containing protein n=1 Tax=Oryzias latipes TaxID=8090 RepID=A0A3B3IMB5_ORYLA